MREYECALRPFIQLQGGLELLGRSAYTSSKRQSLAIGSFVPGLKDPVLPGESMIFT